MTLALFRSTLGNARRVEECTLTSERIRYSRTWPPGLFSDGYPDLYVPPEAPDDTQRPMTEEEKIELCTDAIRALVVGFVGAGGVVIARSVIIRAAQAAGPAVRKAYLAGNISPKAIELVSYSKAAAGKITAKVKLVWINVKTNRPLVYATGLGAITFLAEIHDLPEAGCEWLLSNG